MTNKHCKTAHAAIACILVTLACASMMLAVGCAQSTQPSSHSDTSKAAMVDASDTDAPSSSSQSSAASSSSSASEEASPDEPNPNDAEPSQLSGELQAIGEASGMDVSIQVLDLQTGEYSGYNDSQSMVAASMIKLAIAASFLEHVNAGEFSLDDYYTIQAADIVGGTGTLGGLGAGAQVTYREILNKMISVSDNTGANILINAVGMDAVNATAAELGLSSTQLNRLMMDTDAIASGIENYTSAEDVVTLLRMAYNGTLVNAESSALVVEALEQQQDSNGILGGLPAGVTFAHKTGSLSNARHDGGIVEGAHPYIVAVLCGGAGFSEQGAYATMANVGSTTYASIVG